jgi:hypothetical protein
MFLYEKRPFSNSQFLTNHSIQQYAKIPITPICSNKKLIASPNLNSRLTPSFLIRKSPIVKSRGVQLKLGASKFAINASKLYLDKLLVKGKVTDDLDDEKKLTVPVTRKHRNNLKNPTECKTSRKTNQSSLDKEEFDFYVQIPNLRCTTDESYE